MLDSFKAFLPSGAPDLRAVLTDYKQSVNPETGDLKESGRLENLRVWAGGWGLKIEGSLSKFKYGCNAQSLTRQACSEALAEIGERLRIPIDEAQVSKFEMAQTFIMKRPAVDYLSAFIGAPFLKRTDFEDRETVSFKNTLRELQFYDKVNELIKKGQEVPEVFKGKNTLRYEARFNSRLGIQFNKKIVTVKDLTEEVFYMTAIDKWKDQYFLIQKIRKDRALNMTGQREYLQSLAFYGLQNIGGIDVALDLIKGARLRGEIGKKTGQRLKKLTLSIAQAKPATPETTGEDCIQELDSKVRQAVACYR
jgi:hypothetical protein